MSLNNAKILKRNCMSTKFRNILALLMIFVSTAIFAQVQVSGVVKDDVGEPLAGVMVENANGVSVETDDAGKYTIEANAGEQLKFSSIGFDDKSVAVTGSTLDVQMSIPVEQMQVAKGKEVVVTASGIRREKRSVGAASTTFNNEDLTEASQSNLSESLKGKVPGAIISTSSSDPGASSSVILRGISSLTGSNQPLYVIDGVPVSNNSIGSTSLSGAYDFGNGANDINPDDVENITVLKGASATALYGTKAINGAIIITTKSGKAGKVKVDYSGNVTFSEVSRLPNYQTVFGQGWNGERKLDENGSWGAAFDGKDRVWGRVIDNSQQVKSYNYEPNGVRDFFELGTTYQNNISVSGGSDMAKARLSYSNVKADGIYPADVDSYERNVLGLGGDVEFGRFKFGANLNYINQNGSFVEAGQGLTVYNNLLQMPSDFYIPGFSDYHSKFNDLDGYFTQYGVVNPYYSLNEDAVKMNRDRWYGSFETNYKINDWSNITYRFGLDQYSFNLEGWQAIVAPSATGPNADVAEDGGYFTNQTKYAQLNHDIMYNLDLELTEKLKVQSTIGFNHFNSDSKSLTASISSLDLPGFYNISNTSGVKDVTQVKSEKVVYGVYGTATFNYSDFLYLTLNGRNDWTSTLPKNNRSFFYPGINTSFIFTELWKNNVISFGKIRLGYGETGGDTDPYQVYSENIQGAVRNDFGGNFTFPVGGFNGYEIGNQKENLDLQPLRKKEWEVGTELQFFKNRIGLDFTYYNNKVENQILPINLPSESGYTTQVINAATISNEGIEAMLNLGILRNSKGLSWDMSINYSKNNSKMEEMDSRLNNRYEKQAIGNDTNGRTYLLGSEGMPIFYFKVPVAKMTDDGKIIVDANGVPIKANEEGYAGDTEYDYSLGLTNEFKYKGFKFGFTFDVRQGGLMYSRTADITQFTGNSVKTLYNNRDPFIVPNSVVDNGDGTYSENTKAVDMAHMDDYFSAAALQRNNLIDKSFIKLREVILNYDMPKQWFEQTPIKSMSIGLVGRNLLMWTPSDNQFIDPEASTFGNDSGALYGEYSATPGTRSYSFTLKLGF